MSPTVRWATASRVSTLAASCWIVGEESACAMQSYFLESFATRLR